LLHLKLAVVIVVVLSGLCAWTMVLITRCLQKAEEVVPEEEREDEPLDWPLIGQAALGRPGKLLVGTIFLGDLLMSILTFQVLCGTTLKVIFPSLSLTLLICLSGVLTLLMLLVPEEHLGLASSAGIVATLVFVVAVVVSGACMDERPAATEYKAIDAAGIPGAMAIVVFSMVAHAEAPTIYQPLENKAAFGKISAGAFAVAISMYVAVGIFGYWAYAGDVHPNLLDNLGLNLDGQVAAGLGWLRKLAAALFAAKLQVVQPILLTPVAAMLDVAILGAVADARRRLGLSREQRELQPGGRGRPLHGAGHGQRRLGQGGQRRREREPCWPGQPKGSLGCGLCDADHLHDCVCDSGRAPAGPLGAAYEPDRIYLLSGRRCDVPRALLPQVELEGAWSRLARVSCLAWPGRSSSANRWNH